MPSPRTLHKAIPFLRGAISLLALASFIALFSYPKSPSDPFNTIQQLGLNVCILFAYAYSLYSNNSRQHRPVYPIYRMSLICTAFVLSWVYGMGPLVRILGHPGGCRNEEYQDGHGRCWMQVGVSGLEIIWTVMMFAEGLLTDKRNKDKVYREEMGWEVEEDGNHALANRARAQAQAANRENAAERFGVVEYRPDLSLEGAGGGGATTGSGAGRRRVVGVDEDHEGDGGVDVEMEPLPPYMPKARSNQAVIIDMSHVPQQRPLSTAAAVQDQEQGQSGEEQQQGELTGQDVSSSSSASSSSPSTTTTMQPPPPAQLPPLQPEQPGQEQQQIRHIPGQQHPGPIHPQGGPGTGLPRVPSYSE